MQSQALSNGIRPGQSSTVGCTKKLAMHWRCGSAQVVSPTSLGDFGPVTCVLACNVWPMLARLPLGMSWLSMWRVNGGAGPLELVVLGGSDPDTLVAASGYTPLQAIKRRRLHQWPPTLCQRLDHALAAVTRHDW